MGKIVNACALLADLANASKQYQIWGVTPPADALIRRCTEVNNTTYDYCLFILVSHYQTAMSFKLHAILHYLDTLHPLY